LEGRDLHRVSDRVAAFSFQVFRALHVGCINPRRRERERPVDLLAEVFEVGVVVGGRRDLGRRVAERALHGTEVDAGLADSVACVWRRS
jgi:hypothetical protein